MKFIPGTSIDNDATIDFEGATTGAWLTLPLGPGRPSASVRMTVTDEGLVIDIYPLDGEDKEPVASTYVFDNELSSEWADAEDAGHCERCHDVIRDANGVLIDSTGGDVCEDDLPHIVDPS